MSHESDILKNYTDDRTLSEIRSAGVAHDLNNVLTVITGYAEMLRDDLGDNQLLKEKAERIISAVARARSLTGKLLISANSPAENKTIVNLNDVVAETLDFFRPSLPSEISLITGICTEAILVSADPSELQRVFLNIIRNAVQAMGEKGGSLSVHTLLREDGEKHSNEGNQTGRSGIVTISDTGCGMDSPALQRIFEPYFTSRYDDSGKGIGLYVSREIINELGGAISVSSRKNRGSVFTVCLPLFNSG